MKWALIVSDLRIEIKAPRDLTQGERQDWAGFRAQNPALYSPYFHFGYTSAIGNLCADAHVLTVLRDNLPIAFLPFQAKIKRGTKNQHIGFARPIGSPMTDYHGFICPPDADFDALEVLKLAGFGAFHFNAFTGEAGGIGAYANSENPCTKLSIGESPQAWRAGRDSSYRRHLKSHRRRVRKATEDIGEPRFAGRVKDQVVFDALIKWKKDKFAETGKYDVLSASWTLGLLEALWRQNADADLRCEMHALYFGERLAAIDLGLTDGEVFHSWIVAYDSDLQTYAPGIQLLECLIDASEALGYNSIDLGEGLDGYKRHYASEEVSVRAGFIAATGPAATLSQIYSAAENFGEKNLGGFGKLPGKARRRYRQISACEPTMGGRAKAMFSAVKTSI